MLLSDDPASLAKPELADFATPIEPRPDWRLWTDDFNNLRPGAEVTELRRALR